MTNNSNIIRVKWIDIAKGILILLVVLGHIPVECRMIMAENCKWISYYDVPHHFVRSFFMQAFFILTGLTSSFDKPFSIYLKGCMKGIIIPYLFFSIVTFGISRILWNQPAYFTIGGEKYFFLLENYWFLHALLGAKLLCFVLHRYIKNDFIIASILLAAIALSFSITDSYSDFASPSHYKNYFHYRNTMAMTFFMWFGYLIKGCLNTRKYIIMGGVFVLMSLLSLIATYLHLSEQFSFIRFVMPVPYTHELLENFSLWFIPSYIFYAITGSCLVFGISKLLECINSKFLLFLGQNSLIIYSMHFIILEILIRIVCYMIIPSNAILSALFFIVIFLAAILLCNILIYLINTSVLKIFVGK